MSEQAITPENARDPDHSLSPDLEASENDPSQSPVSISDNSFLTLPVGQGNLTSVFFVNNSFLSDSGNDLIIGNDHINFIGGGGGNDIIDGRGGIDLLSGGTGADTFVYTSRLDGGDRIIDFNPNEGDKINLSLVDSDMHTDTLETLGFAGKQPEGHSVWYFQGQTTTYVFADTDGNLEAQEFVLTLDGSIPLHASDFYL